MRPGVVALLVALPITVQAGDVLTPAEAVHVALTRSPGVAAAQAAVDAASAQLRQDRVLLENPEVDASASVITNRQSVDVAQALSLSGEGWHARAADRAMVEAAAFALTRSRLTLARETRGAWARAVVAADHGDLSREAFDLSTRLRDSVEKRRSAGEASDLDVRLARLAEATAASAWMEVQREQGESATQLLTLVGPFAALPQDPLPAAPAPMTPTGSRSDVAAADARVRAAEAAFARARAAALPAVRVGAFVEHDGPDFVAGPSIGLQIPLWNRNQAEVASQRGDALVARAEARQAHAIADAEASQATTLARDADSVAGLGSTALLDDARTALTEVESAYRAGQLNLADAIEIRNQVIDGESAVLDLAEQVVEARLDLLLATEDPALLPESDR